MSAAVFGKLPAHGDFVARGLSAVRRVEVDDWLSASLAAAQAEYGAAFAERFDRALPWRCAGEAVGGAIAASQDAAGRRFPILVLVDDPEAAEACETLLYAAIGEGWDADRLAREAGMAPSGTPERWWWAGRDDTTLEAAFPPALLTAMLADEVAT